MQQGSRFSFALLWKPRPVIGSLWNFLFAVPFSRREESSISWKGEFEGSHIGGFKERWNFCQKILSPFGVENINGSRKGKDSFRDRVYVSVELSNDFSKKFLAWGNRDKGWFSVGYVRVNSVIHFDFCSPSTDFGGIRVLGELWRVEEITVKC